MTAAHLAVLALAAAAVLLGWGYFLRYRLVRPPLGTVNLGDVSFMVVGIALVPFLYLGLPGFAVGALLALSTLSALVFLFEPILRPRLVVWAAALGLVAADVALAVTVGTTDRAFLLVNDAVLVLVVVGITNLWAQGGLRARDLAILAGAIAVYDAIATGWLPLTTDLMVRLAGLPFMPMAAWPIDDGRWTGIGLGDLLLATVGPLVLRKAYGRAAGLLAVAVALASIVAVMLLGAAGIMRDGFPTMIVLGPLLVAQYWSWSRRGPERTTASYLAAEPHRGA
jgi:hypothetical protein